MATISFKPIKNRPCIDKYGSIKTAHNFPYSRNYNKKDYGMYNRENHVKCVDCGLKKMQVVK